MSFTDTIKRAVATVVPVMMVERRTSVPSAVPSGNMIEIRVFQHAKAVTYCSYVLQLKQFHFGWDRHVPILLHAN